MPSTDYAKHIDQYWHNKAVIGFLSSDPIAKVSYDWIITISFYCALHIIESRITPEMKRRVDPDYKDGKHHERQYIVTHEGTFSDIQGAYIDLFTYSWNARYCFTYDEFLARAARECLGKIEKHFRIA